MFFEGIFCHIGCLDVAICIFIGLKVMYQCLLEMLVVLCRIVKVLDLFFHCITELEHLVLLQ